MKVKRKVIFPILLLLVFSGEVLALTVSLAEPVDSSVHSLCTGGFQGSSLFILMDNEERDGKEDLEFAFPGPGSLISILTPSENYPISQCGSGRKDHRLISRVPIRKILHIYNI